MLREISMGIGLLLCGIIIQGLDERIILNAAGMMALKMGISQNTP